MTESISRTASGPDEETYKTLAEQYSVAHAKLLLFGAEKVIAENTGVVSGLESAANALGEIGDDDARSFGERVRDSYLPQRSAITASMGRMIAAMKHELKGRRFEEELAEADYGSSAGPTA